MSKSKEYKAIKNYIHNELGLTKEDIIKELDPILKRIMHQYMNNAYGCDNDLEGWVKYTVAAEIKRVGYDFVREIYLEALKKTIADQLDITVKPKEKVELA